jgi:VIT1/CCC1 family predicted Fe2+/Mn2+ transporter
MRSIGHHEIHKVDRIGWLRAAVLGANDGIISTASLIVGIAAATSDKGDVVIAGVAGLAAGAMSMAAGEYVSVSAQSDIEQAEISRERRELLDDPEAELDELTGTYEARGLDPDLARQVATQLTERDALGTHMREELNISEMMAARPLQAAAASGAAFAVGAALPLLVAVVSVDGDEIIAVSLTALISLAVLGALGAKAGGANMVRAATRVCFWGALAMAATAAVGEIFGAIL